MLDFLKDCANIHHYKVQWIQTIALVSKKTYAFKKILLNFIALENFSYFQKSLSVRPPVRLWVCAKLSTQSPFSAPQLIIHTDR